MESSAEQIGVGATLPGAFSLADQTVVEQVMSTMRVSIQRDGGDIELISCANDVVRVRLRGACLHCALATHTLGTLRRELVAALGRPVRVLPAAN